MTSPLAGGCLCGGTRYVLSTPPTDLNDCHCLDCRRSSGAAYVTWGTVPRATLTVTAGTVRELPHADRVRSWAACCGTHLFFADSPASATIDVTIASLDEPAPFAPRCAIWTEDRLPWVVLNGALPAHRRSSRD